MDADGSNQTRLTYDLGADNSPSWSPDGTRIVFASNRGGEMDLWVMNADGSNPVQITNTVESESHPAWAH
jgi:TolB protein